MFTDMTISTDLNTGFKDWLQGNDYSNGRTFYNYSWNVTQFILVVKIGFCLFRRCMKANNASTITLFLASYSGLQHFGTHCRILACQLDPTLGVPMPCRAGEEYYQLYDVL